MTISGATEKSVQTLTDTIEKNNRATSLLTWVIIGLMIVQIFVASIALKT